MLHTASLLALLSLAPSQAGLKLTDVHIAYGLLGPARPDLKILPGDSVIVEFNIQGITTDPAGKVAYSMGVEVTDSGGKVHSSQKPTPQESVLSLGGNVMPGFAKIDIGVDQAPGEYTAKITVTDLATKSTQTATQKIQVMAPTFGIVQLSTTSDPNGTVPSGLVSVGESVWVNFAVVRFMRDKAKQQPNLEFQMVILDDSGKPVLAKPDSGVVDSEVPASEKLIGVQFELTLNRPGKFVVRLSAADKLSGKKSSMSFSLVVFPNQ